MAHSGTLSHERFETNFRAAAFVAVNAKTGWLTALGAWVIRYMGPTPHQTETPMDKALCSIFSTCLIPP
eukprot:354208-Chlamydomonas_euryale.AAC.5